MSICTAEGCFLVLNSVNICGQIVYVKTTLNIWYTFTNNQAFPRFWLNASFVLCHNLTIYQPDVRVFFVLHQTEALRGPFLSALTRGDCAVGFYSCLGNLNSNTVFKVEMLYQKKATEERPAH